MYSATKEEGDIFVGAINFLHSLGLKPKPANFEAQEEHTEAAPPEPTPAEPTPAPEPTKYCSCVKNPHYQAPPEPPLELHSDVEARYGRNSKWLKAKIVQIHKLGKDDHSKWLYDIQYESTEAPLMGFKMRRCLIRDPNVEPELKLFCTACGLPPKNAKGFKSFKAGKGDRTFWAKPEVLYGVVIIPFTFVLFAI